MTEPEVREVGTGETALAFEALRELRPQYSDQAEMVKRIDEVQRPEGYRIAAAFLPGEERAGAAAGFRILHLLPWGKRALYIDDLTTVPAARRKGLAGALLRWLVEEARREGCDQLHLDSAVGPERQDAHRLYFNHGMRISSYHFQMPID